MKKKENTWRYGNLPETELTGLSKLKNKLDMSFYDETSSIFVV